MAKINSRKHVPPRFQSPMGLALAAMLLPVGAHAADTPDTTQVAALAPLQQVTITTPHESKFKAVKAESPKYTEALIDTAQTLTVIKKDLIDQQGAVTLTEALRNTPGVGAFFLGENGSTNTGDAIFMRGFDTSGSIYVDGVRDIGSISRDVFNIEEIDVLKGPAGTDNGRSAPTGSVNLVTKQPTKDRFFNSIINVGSGDRKRASLDWNYAFNENDSAFRLNLLDQESGNPARREVRNNRWAIAPSLAFGLKGNTRLYLDFLHVRQNNVPDGGVPTIGLPGYTSPDATRPFLSAAAKVDPKNFYGLTSDFDKVTADMLTARIDHVMSPTLKLQNTARYGKTSQNYLLTAFMGNTANLLTPRPLDPSSWTLARSTRTIKDQDNEILTNQTTLTAQIDSGTIKQTLVAGLELTSEKQTTYGYSGTGTLPAANLYHPDPTVSASGLKLVRNGVFSDGSTSTQSAYLFDTVKVGEQWIFNGAVRFDHYRTSYQAAALSTATSHPALPVGTLVPTNLELSDTLFNGKISALFKPTKDSSVYVMTATSKLPPGGTNFALSTSANSAANPKFEPQVTNTTEIGTKWDFLKQKLAITGALYRTEVKNEVEQDPVDLQYYQTGKKRVQGIEVGVIGEFSRNWLVSAGYTRMQTSVESGKIVTASGINALNYTPKQAFSAWTSYSLPSGFKLGGGARYVGKLLRGTDGAIGTPAFAVAYWVFDAMASYRLNKQIELQLNVYNLGNKDYIAAINKSGYRYTPGAPRSASLTANLSF